MLDPGSTISMDTSSLATPGGMKRAGSTKVEGGDGMVGENVVVVWRAETKRRWLKEVARGGKKGTVRRRRSMESKFIFKLL
jgi:hypothetical protein